VLPRCLILERVEAEGSFLAIGLNPGRSSAGEREFYVRLGLQLREREAVLARPSPQDSVLR
jgi:hypothetical protein